MELGQISFPTYSFATPSCAMSFRSTLVVVHSKQVLVENLILACERYEVFV